MMRLSKNAVSAVLEISGTLDIDGASSLREALLDALLHQTEVTADLSRVDECDAAALQVLLAGRKDAESRGKRFRLMTASRAVTDTAKALGLRIDAPGNGAGKELADGT